MDIETSPSFSRRIRQIHNFKVTFSLKVKHGVELTGLGGTHRIARDDMVFGRHGDIKSENMKRSQAVATKMGYLQLRTLVWAGSMVATHGRV